MRSPFLYLGLVVLVGAGFAAFLLDKSNEPVLAVADIFDQSQYLFSEPNKPVGVKEAQVLAGVFFEPISPPFLVSGKTMGSLVDFGPKKEVFQYVVEQGDTPASVAEKFGISLETVLLVNDLTSRSVLKPGKELTILPVSGMLHVVQQGDTLSGVAQLYQVKAQEIIEINDLGEEGKLFAGDFLIVPGAKKPKVVPKYTTVPVPQSYFICPIPSPCRVSQGLHWYNAVDFSNNKCGEPVYAAAAGTVQRVGYTGLGGNYVRIVHTNGVVTYYGHLSNLATGAGSNVSQGQIIGYVGYSGVTYPKGPNGCHLHLEVLFAQNPFSGYAVGSYVGK